MLTKLARMLVGAAILLACQEGGGWLATRLAWPLPGPVLGMMLLAVVLTLLGRTPQGLSEVASWLLKAMPLFFIPAGVGILLLSETLRAAWLPITAALLASTLIALATTATVMKGLARRLARTRAKEPS
jgi:holin-like protein